MLILKDMKTGKRSQYGRSKGFTIIEVMIVLAIAGLIILIMLLAVPALQRNGRNYARRQAVDYVATQLLTFRSDNGEMPLVTDNQDCVAAPNCVNFVAQLKKEGSAKNMTVDYGSNETPHEVPYTDGANIVADNYDHIYIIPAHWCNRSATAGPGDPDYPVYSVGNDNNFGQYAVYTMIEPSGRIYCSDSKN